MTDLIQQIDNAPLTAWEKADLRNRLRTWAARWQAQTDERFGRFFQYKLDSLAAQLKAGRAEGSVHEVNGCHNFGLVEGWDLLRSSQPSSRDLEWLHSQGVKSVINLRRDLDYGDDYTAGEEAETCRTLGLTYIHMPMDDSEPPPPIDDLLAAMRTWVDAPRPALVHCWMGLGRTGMVTMLYRLDRCRWTLDQALKEAQSYGYDAPYRERQIKQLRRYASTLGR